MVTLGRVDVMHRCVRVAESGPGVLHGVDVAFVSHTVVGQATAERSGCMLRAVVLVLDGK